MTHFTLEPQDRPEPPPVIRVLDWSHMEGRTIRCVIDRPQGKQADRCDAVIVFEDDSWATVMAETDGCGEDSASVTLGCRGFSKEPSVSEWLSPDQLLQARLVNHAQHAFLAAQRRDEEAKERAARAARMRADADRLEAQISSNQS